MHVRYVMNDIDNFFLIDYEEPKTLGSMGGAGTEGLNSSGQNTMMSQSEFAPSL